MTTNEEKRAATNALMDQAFGHLYEVDGTDRIPFGKHWCGPPRFEHGEDALVATYDPTSNDGQKVEVYCYAPPARGYVIKALPSGNQRGFKLSTGTGAGHLVATIAEAIASATLGFDGVVT